MSKQVNISEEKRREILAAADELEKEGKKITIDATIERMGGGSVSYVSPVLRERRERKLNKQVISGDLSDEVLMIADQAAKHTAQLFGEVYQRQANHKIEQGLMESNINGQLLNEQCEELEAENSKLFHARDILEKEKEMLLEQKSGLVNEVSVKDMHILTLQTELDNAKQALTEKDNKLKDQQRDFKTLQEKHQIGTEQLEEKQQQIEKLQQKQKSTQADLVTAEQALADKDNQLKDQQRDFKTLKGKHDDLASQKSVFKASIKQLEGKADTLQTDLTRAVDQSAALQRMLEKAQDVAENARSENLKLKTKVTALETRVDDRNITIGKLETENKSLREIKEQHAIDKSALEINQSRLRELSRESGELKQENKKLYRRLVELENANQGEDRKPEAQSEVRLSKRATRKPAEKKPETTTDGLVDSSELDMVLCFAQEHGDIEPDCRIRVETEYGDYNMMQCGECGDTFAVKGKVSKVVLKELHDAAGCKKIDQ